MELLNRSPPAPPTACAPGSVEIPGRADRRLRAQHMPLHRRLNLIGISRSGERRPGGVYVGRGGGERNVCLTGHNDSFLLLRPLSASANRLRIQPFPDCEVWRVFSAASDVGTCQRVPDGHMPRVVPLGRALQATSTPTWGPRGPPWTCTASRPILLWHDPHCCKVLDEERKEKNLLAWGHNAATSNVTTW